MLQVRPLELAGVREPPPRALGPAVVAHALVGGLSGALAGAVGFSALASASSYYGWGYHGWSWRWYERGSAALAFGACAGATLGAVDAVADLQPRRRRLLVAVAPLAAAIFGCAAAVSVRCVVSKELPFGREALEHFTDSLDPDVLTLVLYLASVAVAGRIAAGPARTAGVDCKRVWRGLVGSLVPLAATWTLLETVAYALSHGDPDRYQVDQHYRHTEVFSVALPILLGASFSFEPLARALETLLGPAPEASPGREDDALAYARPGPRRGSAVGRAHP